MIRVDILEPSDTLLGDDWCRPLLITSMSGGHSDYYSFECSYTGPENNVKWVPVNELFEKWIGTSLSELMVVLNKHTPYEFVRGEIPRRHQYGPTNRLKKEMYNEYLDNIVKVGKYKNKTWKEVRDIDYQYYDWAERKGWFMSYNDFELEIDKKWQQYCEDEI